MAVEGRYFTWTLAAGEDLADLRGANLHGVSLRGANLTEAVIAQDQAQKTLQALGVRITAAAI